MVMHTHAHAKQEVKPSTPTPAPAVDMSKYVYATKVGAACSGRLCPSRKWPAAHVLSRSYRGLDKMERDLHVALCRCVSALQCMVDGDTSACISMPVPNALPVPCMRQSVHRANSRTPFRSCSPGSHMSGMYQSNCTLNPHSQKLLLGCVCSAAQADAKDAFKELLTSVSCSAEWSWEQALKHIVNDPR
jgi:hypothetical protein